MKKKVAFSVIVLWILAGGCQQPAEVQLVPENNETNLEVHPVVVPDTNIRLSSIDSTGVLPEDQVDYNGILTINSVVLDAGNGIHSFANSRVFFADTSVRFFGRLLGFNGIDLGGLLLNSSPMFRIAHWIVVKRIFDKDTVLLRGVEYVSDLSGSYQPGKTYIWSTVQVTVRPVNVSIQAPDSLIVFSPRGGTIIPRDQDLAIRWRGGKGNVSIIVSTYNLATTATHPLLEFRTRVNTGQALIPAKLLRELPQQKYFVFTFVLYNRVETTVFPWYGGRILVQAASVYNSYVELR